MLLVLYNQWRLKERRPRLLTPCKPLVPPSSSPADQILVGDLAVVVLVGGGAEHPAPGPELQDLQQQQASHGGEALLEQEAVPQEEEELVHALAVHLLQLLTDAMQLQHQAVHLHGTDALCLIATLFNHHQNEEYKDWMCILTSSSFIRASG